MSYEGEPDEKPRIYGDPEPEIDDFGWEYTDKPCPECGGEMQHKVHDYETVTEIEECCDHCEYYGVYYE